MNICVVGSGYVGLVTGACLADFGMTVVGVDKEAALRVRIDHRYAVDDPVVHLRRERLGLS